MLLLASARPFQGCLSGQERQSHLPWFEAPSGITEAFAGLRLKLGRSPLSSPEFVFRLNVKHKLFPCERATGDGLGAFQRGCGRFLEGKVQQGL